MHDLGRCYDLKFNKCVSLLPWNKSRNAKYDSGNGKGG